MKRDTHLLVGVGVSFFILNPLKSLDIIIVFLGSIIGSLLPDLDLKIRHRVLLHNLPIIVLVIVLVVLLETVLTPRSSIIFLDMYKYFTTSIVISWILHIITDMVNPSGVSILWPLAKSRFKLCRKCIRHDSILGNAILKALGLMLLLYYAHRLLTSTA